MGVRKSMKNLTEEQVKSIKSWAKTAKEESEKLTVVLNGIKKQLCKEKQSNLVAKCIDKNWKEFVGLFNLEMPHIVWNGTKAPTPCEWVVAKENSNLNKAFRQYRYAGEDIVKLDKCEGSIKREVEEKVMVKFVHESGYVQELAARDKDGNPITMQKECRLVPREKSIWGYTETVINAFVNAADELVELHKNDKDEEGAEA